MILVQLVTLFSIFVNETYFNIIMRRFAISLLIILSASVLCQAQVNKEITTIDGLSSSLVHCLCQDKYGNIWIGTRNGLNRYNGVYIKSFRYDPADSCSLASNLVNTLLQDDRGHLIVGTQQGLQIYDWDTGLLSAPLGTAEGVPYKDNVNTVIQRANGEVWASGARIFEIVFPEGKQPYLVYKDYSEGGLDGSLREDAAGDLWLAKFNSGIYRLQDNGKVTHLPQNMFGGSSLSVCSGPDRKLYIVNNLGEAMALDIDNMGLTSYDSGPLKGCWPNTVQYLNDGKVLIGTDGNGCFQLDPESGKVTPFVIENTKLHSSSLKPHAFLEDTDGNLWMGIYGRGVFMIPKYPNQFHYLGSLSADADVVGSRSITSLLFDRHEQLWVGTDGDGIYVLGRGGTLLRHYEIPERHAMNVLGLTEDSSGKIWFGSYSKGLWRLDPASGNISKSTAFSSFDNSDQSVFAIEEDSRNRLWLATMGSGLYYYDLKSGNFTIPDITANHILNSWQNDIAILGDSTLYVATFGGLYELDIRTKDISLVRTLLADHIVYTLHYDGEVMYAGMSDGLAVINLQTEEQQIYTTQDGLPDNYIAAIHSSGPGRIWISTNSGLAYFDRAAGRFERYYSTDGFRIREFSINSSAASPGSYLFFGGNEGIVYFDTNTISKQSRKWTPRIIGFQVGGTDRPITEDLHYDLQFDENNCTISFTTAEFDAPAGLEFRYSTDMKNWIPLPQGENSVTMSDMTAGHYSFAVKVIDDDIESDPVSVSVHVLRPWWGSALALAIYTLLALLFLAIMVRMLIQRLHYTQELSRQKQVQKTNEEKVQFLMDMSHEIRSPMTLVMAPLHKLMESDTDPARQHYYAVMDRNANHILRVVDQMLDLRKVDKGQIQLSCTDVNLADFTSSLSSLFKEQARIKGLTFTFPQKGADGPVVSIDRNHFDKVIINLLSNAVKFTPSGGSIDVRVGSKGEEAFIEVRDTGPGMSKETLDKVFDRFYRGDTAVSGTGIGLNLARTIVELHNGKISAENNADGPGSLFRVALPIEGEVHPQVAQFRKGKTIVVAEDNLEIRHFLHDELYDTYNIIECVDGKEAYETILQTSPDLVISDVIMPLMDGFTLCKKIRHNPNVSHLPVILLTARTLEEDRIRGLEAGVDAYLTKPFNMDVLKKTVTNLLENRDRLMVSFSEPKVTNMDIKDVDIQTPDERLLERVMKVINERLDDPSLKVDTVAQEVGLSRVHLYRKIKELTNMTTNEFIKNIRLKKAAEMLSTGKYSIAELSEAVGFSSATYFATAFKNLYGTPPSEYARNSSSQDSRQEDRAQQTES